MTKTYAQITREIAALRATADKLYALELKDAVVKVNAVIAKYKLSADDLRFAGSSPGSSSKASVIADTSGLSGAAIVPRAKYSDGQGQSWGGRGPRPAWLRRAMDAGRSLESFLTGATSAAAALPLKGGARVAHRTQATRPATASVPKYHDPRTGVTWSGRGPRPQWLKAALRKRGSVIEDFLIGAMPETKVVAAAPSPAVVSVKKTVVKKAPAKKSVTTKSAPRTLQVPTVATSVGQASAKKVRAKTLEPKSAAKALGLKTAGTKKTVKAPAPAAAPSIPASVARKTGAAPSKKSAAPVKQPSPSAASKVLPPSVAGEQMSVPAAPRTSVPRTKAKKTVITLPDVPVAVTAPALPEPAIPSVV